MPTPPKLYSTETLEQRRARLCENSKRHRLRHGDEVRAKERKRYAERKAAMQQKARQHYADNREARIASSRRWQAANPDKVSDSYRRHNLWRWYRMTVEEYDVMFERQDRKCGVCRCSEVPAKHHWHVDHNHSTGEIRGILCSNCNLMIGHAKDNPDTLLAGIRLSHCFSVKP